MRYAQDIRCTLAIMLSLVGGCTTQSYAPASDAVTRELKIKAGDEIRVVTTRRERLSFKVSEVRDDRFIGVTGKPHPKELHPAGERVEVPFDELAVLEVTRFETRGAALATAAVLVTVSAFAVVLGTVPAVPPGP
jgi:hypothetical protein